MPAADQLAVEASNLLASLVARLAGYGSPVPTRHYVHVGQVAYDLGICDQLVVAFERYAPGPPGGENELPLPGPQAHHALLAVHLMRCVPTSTGSGRNLVPPSPAELTATATQQLTDVLALRRAARDGMTAGDWGSSCGPWLLGEVVPVGPSGGVGAIVMRLYAQL